MMDKEALIEDVGKPLLAGGKVMLVNLFILAVLMSFGNLVGLYDKNMNSMALGIFAIPAGFFGYFFGRVVGGAAPSFSWQLLVAAGLLLLVACQIPAAIAAFVGWNWTRHHSEAAWLVFFVTYGVAAWKIWDAD